MYKNKCIFIIIWLITHNVFSQTKPSHLEEWLDNKYAMFIHFGIYSQLGGVWNGQNITFGYSEQIQSHAGIFSDIYAETAEHFLPSKWNADSVVLLAKRAGMRSIVITSKHHDGFCMFKTKTTDFNIVDATPFKRDVVKELSEACKRHGLHFGLYFSLIDWHYPQAYPISSHNADFITPEHHEFSKKQLQELLTNYGSISELWFDMGSLTLQQSSELRALVKKWQPDCMISGRLGNDQGDFCVMGDNEYPDYAIVTPWQVPASMYNETWGFRSWQKHVPVEQKVHEKLLGLIKTVTRGGNYILNIGPKGDGSVTEFEQNVLTEIGKWLKINGEAIYQTKPLALQEPSPFGEMTTKDNKIYFHLFNSPTNNQVVLKGVLSKIKKIYALDAPEETLVFNQNSDSLTISLPNLFLKKAAIRVIVIENDGIIAIKPKNNIELKPLLTLSNQNAQHQYSFSGVDYYTSYRSTVKYEWHVHNGAKNKVQPTLFYSDEEKEKSIVLSINGKQIPISFSDGEMTPLSKNDIKWGDIAISGRFFGSIEHVNDHLNDIDIQQKWSKKDWQPVNGWKTNALYWQPAGLYESWYWLQEITTTTATQTLIRLPTNDGLAVYLNGQEVFVINNPTRDTSLESTILLPLESGSNKLLVKYFNRFNKGIKMGIFTNIPQILYKKALPEMVFEKDRTYQLDLQLPPQYRIHQNMDAPNCSIELKYN